jgi:hypothetical protein
MINLKRKMMPTASNDSAYVAWVYAISLMGAIAIFMILNSNLVAAAFFTVFWVCMMMMWIHKVKKHQARIDEKLFSFSRPESCVIGDLIVKTVEVSVFSLILDAASKGVTLASITDPNQAAALAKAGFNVGLFVSISALLFIAFWASLIFLIGPAASNERQ